MIWSIIERITQGPDDVAKLGKVVDAVQAAASSPGQVADTCRVVAYAAGTPGGFDKVRAALQVRSDSLVEDAPAPVVASSSGTGSSSSGSSGSSSSGSSSSGSSSSGSSTGSSGTGSSGTGSSGSGGTSS